MIIVNDLIAEADRLCARGDDPGELRALFKALEGNAYDARWIANQALDSGNTLTDTAFTLGIYVVKLCSNKAC